MLARLNDIARALENSEQALALIGLGSVGVELDRLDDYSDLDFFAIVDQGSKLRFIENLDWLSSVCPIAYHYQNTPDGHKLLFVDGVFCEFAVFEPGELRTIPFSRGRVVWKRPQVDDAIAIPAHRSSLERSTQDWLLGEALTNLYVGLCRRQRGEIWSATRFIQGYAVDRVLELASYIEEEQPVQRDAFANERRYERRFPTMAHELRTFMQGYQRNQESAQAMLGYLERRFPVNPAMANAIRELCGSSTLGE
ncbi:MAG: hypothetical protein MZW92_71065 [Comamonadaceae bacterium]|nr:hypothetical protein [Comamonadaceae bacterium]